MRGSLASIVLVPRGEWGTPPTREERRAVLRWAKEAGFAGIEFNPRWLDFHAMAGPELDAFREEVAAAGLVLSGLCINRCILTRTPRAEEHLRRLERGVEVAARLGTPTLTFSLSMPTLPDGEAALRVLAPRATCWHVKKYRRGEPSPVWSGDIDYRRALTLMRAAGFRGWVSVESYFGDVRDLQVRSLRFLEELASAWPMAHRRPCGQPSD